MRKKLDDENENENENENEFLIESYDGNLLREWRAIPNEGPWSYSRSSRVFEEKNPKKKTPKKALVITGNVNIHSPSKPLSMTYDCRMNMIDGRLKNRDCMGKSPRKNRIKRWLNRLRRHQ